MTSWTARERRWRDGLLCALIPAGPAEQLPGLDDIDTEPFWTEVDRAAPPLLRLGLRVAVWTLTFAPLLLLGRLRTFVGLTPDERDRLLQRAASSRWYLLRQLVLMLKAMACFAYFREPDARAFFQPHDRPSLLPEPPSEQSGGP